MRKDRTGTKNNQDSAIKITYLKFKKKSLTFNKTKIKSSLQKLYFTLLYFYFIRTDNVDSRKKLLLKTSHNGNQRWVLAWWATKLECRLYLYLRIHWIQWIKRRQESTICQTVKWAKILVGCHENLRWFKCDESTTESMTLHWNFQTVILHWSGLIAEDNLLLPIALC